MTDQLRTLKTMDWFRGWTVYEPDWKWVEGGWNLRSPKQARGVGGHAPKSQVDACALHSCWVSVHAQCVETSVRARARAPARRPDPWPDAACA